MTTRLAPSNIVELAEIVGDAHRQNTTLEIRGSGSRHAYGRPVAADRLLDVGGMAGIVDYDPDELILTLRPGTRLAEVEALLDAHGQHLAFEPPDLGPLLGQAAGAGTIGGAIGCGLSGPRRPMAGGLRDHLLGFEAVNGYGERIVAGGKVIKNVTGYDLPKLIAGSWGTLAVLGEATFKVAPNPAMSQTLRLHGLDTRQASQAMIIAMGAPVAISGAAHLPPGRLDGSASQTALRIEGTPASVSARLDNLERLLNEIDAERDLLEGTASAHYWREIASAAPLAAEAGDAILRISLPPSAAPRLSDALDAIAGGRSMLDWGGGLMWRALPAIDAMKLDEIRALAAALTRGAAGVTLVRAAETLRLTASPFPPLEARLAELNRKVRARFDPKRILNPGRIHEDL